LSSLCSSGNGVLFQLALKSLSRLDSILSTYEPSAGAVHNTGTTAPPAGVAPEIAPRSLTDANAIASGPS
jgi:hypothetical protein